MDEMNEGLFDDIVDDMPVEDVAEDTAEEPVFEETDSVETAEPEPVETEPFLKIKYDKEEIGLSREEAKELAEKGKNYDRMRDRYNAINEPIEKLARLYGMDVPAFIESLNESQSRFEVNKELNELKGRYPNADEEILSELANSRVKERLSLKEKQIEEQKIQTADKEEQEIKRQLDMFRNEYPTLEPDKLDKAVYDYVRQGYTLLEAYTKWARTQEDRNRPAIENQLRAKAKNEENRKKSLGNTSNVGSGDSDDFLSGFLSV